MMNEVAIDCQYFWAACDEVADIRQRFGWTQLSISAGTLIVIKEPGEDSNRRRYVQFMQKDDQLISKVVANRFLEGDARASTHGNRIIRAAGWVQQGHSDLENWETRLRWPASASQYRALAEMIVIALRDGYGIESPESWRYKAWNDRRGNDPVELKRLGLAEQQ